MKRIMPLLFALAFLAMTMPAFAQIKGIGVSGGLSLPTGGFGNVAGTGFGGSVRMFYEYEDLENILLTGTVGYYRFANKDFQFLGQTTVGYKWTLIPLMSGARYYLGEPDARQRVFVGGEIGFHIYSVSVNSGGTSFNLGTYGNSTEFAIQPTVGFQLGGIEVSALYSIADLNYFGANVMYVFPVGQK